MIVTLRATKRLYDEYEVVTLERYGFVFAEAGSGWHVVNSPELWIDSLESFFDVATSLQCELLVRPMCIRETGRATVEVFPNGVAQ